MIRSKTGFLLRLKSVVPAVATVRAPTRCIVACALLLTPDTAISAMKPFGASDLFDTSEYALGLHTLNVVFIQDNQLRDPNDVTHPVVPGGSIIHWTPAELASRSQRVISAANYWNGQSGLRHHPAAQLDMRVNFVNDGNPITVADIGGEGSSIGYGDALAMLDPQYGAFSDVTAVRHFNHDTRVAFGTHWASTVFVKPYNGRASAFLNGPYVNAYEDDSTWTHAHEYGHTFGALDEYGSAVTSSRSGYLYEFNTNAVNLPNGSSNPDSIPAVMRTRDVYTISDGTIGQIGWRDTDGDTVPDILDTHPTLVVDGSPSNSATGLAHIELDSVVTPLPSPDPSEGDYTINTIMSGEYRLNDGNWQALAPSDGAFGDYTETFSIQLTELPYGTHDIEMRIANSVDNVSVEAFAFVSTLVTPDFSADGSLGCEDVDALVAAIAAMNHAPQFDLTGDGSVDASDLDNWLTAAGAANLASGNAYLPGDANLDGAVNGEDFLTWNTHKFTDTAAWCSGDFTASGVINGADFLVWNAHKFMTADRPLVSVPAPATFASAVIWLVAVVLFRSRTSN